jgi:haloalkane dehalogenase
MAEYRRPYVAPEGRRPTLSWPRQIPIEGEPADVTEIVSNYAEWLPRSSVRKLFVNGEPGAGLTGSRRDFCRTWSAQREVTVRGLHFLQEDSPHEIWAGNRRVVRVNTRRWFGKGTITLRRRRRQDRPEGPCRR